MLILQLQNFKTLTTCLAKKHKNMLFCVHVKTSPTRS